MIQCNTKNAGTIKVNISIFFYISDIINPIFSFSGTLIKDHYSLFLSEIEPMIIADHLFKYGVFNIDIHDEIEAEKGRRKRAQLILHYLEGEFSSSIPTFVHVLEITEQHYFLFRRIYELYIWDQLPRVRYLICYLTLSLCHICKPFVRYNLGQSAQLI